MTLADGTPVRVRFVGSAGEFNSVATQAVRVYNGLTALNDPRLESELVLLPRNTFRRGRLRSFLFSDRRPEQLARLVEGTDILVVVKASLLRGFTDVAADLQRLCRSRGVILVSSPADGVESAGLNRRDVFSEDLADYVLTIGSVQHNHYVARRGADSVMYVGTATRPRLGVHLEIRDEVKAVVWENPPHHDPFAKPEINGTPKAEHEEFERRIAAFCEERGARLITFGFWRDLQDDKDWENALLSADIAMECKALNRQYTSYQLQKPPVKLQNYLALGMPTVCDSLPGHLDVGRPAGVLFADTIEEWEQALESLFASRELRARMSEAGRAAVQSSSIEAVAARYLECFVQMRVPAGVN